MRSAWHERTPDKHFSMLGGSDTLRDESSVLVCPEGNRVLIARAYAGGDPIGNDLLARHLPPGVASVHPVPDHDPEGCRRNPANGVLDTVRPAAQDYPGDRSWTGWSVRFLGCSARHNDTD